MSTYSSAQGTQSSHQYPPRYPPNNNNQQFINPNNTNTQQQTTFPSYPSQQQYSQQQQYPSQQQQYYQQPQPNSRYPPSNNPQYPPIQQNYNQYNQYPPQQSQQNQLSQQPYINPQTVPPTPIPQNSPLLRHPLSQIISIISKNKQQFSQDFNKKFQDNQDFKSLNRKVVFIPSLLVISHVIMNRNKKWFRLTVNAPLIRYSLLGLFMLHLSTNVLYVAAFRDLIARNREKIEKVVVREQFLGSSNK